MTDYKIVVPEGFEIADIKVQFKPVNGGRIPVTVRPKTVNKCACCCKPCEEGEICRKCFFRNQARFQKLINQECFL